MVLVACAGTKLGRAAKAKDLYVSSLFKKSRAWAECHGDRWYILSAKHGLLDPERVIRPYEKTLNQAGRVECRAWAARVMKTLDDVLPGRSRVVFLAGDRYRRDLVPALKARGHSVECPVEGLRIGQQLSWLNGQRGQGKRSARATMTSARNSDLDRFYRVIDDLRDKPGQYRPLGDYTGRSGLPARGVYFFFEPGEDRSVSSSRPRVVRIGTHAVSRGAKLKLWSRLYSHRGTQQGGGNHRGSIFRLLVGEALRAKRQQTLDTWSNGGTAPKETRRRERWLEELVSAHIRQMPIVWLDINDESGPDSARAYIERNAIALLSSGLSLADPPSRSWLGRHSRRDNVRRSGLWNINHVGDEYSPEFLEEMEGFAENTT